MILNFSTVRFLLLLSFLSSIILKIPYPGEQKSKKAKFRVNTGFFSDKDFFVSVL
jgi:hypothetical protein